MYFLSILFTMQINRFVKASLRWNENIEINLQITFFLHCTSTDNILVQKKLTHNI